MESTYFSRSDPLFHRQQHEDQTVITIDFGQGTNPTVDVVDNTVLIVTSDGQREIDVPDGSVQAFNRNGIVVIEVEQ